MKNRINNQNDIICFRKMHNKMSKHDRQKKK